MRSKLVELYPSRSMIISNSFYIHYAQKIFKKSVESHLLIQSHMFALYISQSLVWPYDDNGLVAVDQHLQVTQFSISLLVRLPLTRKIKRF